MARPSLWRVRVNRVNEAWVEVDAYSDVEAEAKARSVPGVVSVFGRSAIRVDEPERERQAGVMDG